MSFPPLLRESIASYFEAAGWQVLYAASAKQALALLARHNPVVVFTDIRLGGLLSGWAVGKACCERILHLRPRPSQKQSRLTVVLSRDPMKALKRDGPTECIDALAVVSLVRLLASNRFRAASVGRVCPSVNWTFAKNLVRRSRLVTIAIPIAM